MIFADVRSYYSGFQDKISPRNYSIIHLKQEGREKIKHGGKEETCSGKSLKTIEQVLASLRQAGPLPGVDVS